MTILLTGFDSFGKLRANPSQIVVQRMGERAGSGGRDPLVTEVLSTAYATAGKRMRELIRETRPSAVVALGVAAGRKTISLERVALNLDDSSAPDNAGDQADGRLIVPDGPTAYWSSLPLARLQKALQDRDIPVNISNHAGTFVCNHVFYVARHEIEQLGIDTMCGFIHLPLMSEQIETATADTPSLPLDVILQGVECCLDVLER